MFLVPKMVTKTTQKFRNTAPPPYLGNFPTFYQFFRWLPYFSKNSLPPPKPTYLTIYIFQPPSLIYIFDMIYFSTPLLDPHIWQYILSSPVLADPAAVGNLSGQVGQLFTDILIDYVPWEFMVSWITIWYRNFKVKYS